MDRGWEPRGAEAPPDDEVMGLREAVILFGGLAVIIQGIGAVLCRLNGWPASPTACLAPFLYAAAGFVGARHAARSNGVWAAIAVTALDASIGALLAAVINPAAYQRLAEQVPAGGGGAAILAIMMVLTLIGIAFTLLWGALWGLIGAAIAHASPFRPARSAPVR